MNNGGDICAEDLLQVLNKHGGNQQLGNDIAGIHAIKDWSSAQAEFETKLLTQLHPLFPTTRKLAERLSVSHNKIAMKLREHGIK